MLYVSTRSKIEVSTPIRAMRENRAPDGGLYLPARIPELSKQEVNALLQQTPWEIIAQILNRFFGTKLEGRQIHDAMEGEGIRTATMSHRIMFCELWHRNGRRWEDLLRTLSALVAQEPGAEAGTWMRVCVKVAMLFAHVAQQRRNGQIGHEEQADLFVMSGDLIGYFAGWYAARMGLPLGTIVCCCNENSGLWDLIHRGQIKLDARRIDTGTPECDHVVPPGLELLIYAALGAEEAERFVEKTRQGGTYLLGPEQQRHFREGLDVCVVNSRRLGGVIHNLYRTNGYVLCPYSALTYAGLMDYRSTKRRRNPALILSVKSPLQSLALLSPLLGTDAETLRRHICRW